MKATNLIQQSARRLSRWLRMGTAAVVLGALSVGSAWAATTTINLNSPGTQPSDGSWTKSLSLITLVTAGDYVLTGDALGRYRVQVGQTTTPPSTTGNFTITLNGCSIDATSLGGAALDVSNAATTTITITGTNTLTGGGVSEGKGYAGIHVGSSTLELDGTGTLTATGGMDAAGIGENEDFSSTIFTPTITINGGRIHAATTPYSDGTAFAAGIGGDGESGIFKGTININGGTITTAPLAGANGIGAGYDQTEPTINIANQPFIVTFTITGYGTYPSPDWAKGGIIIMPENEQKAWVEGDATITGDVTLPAGVTLDLGDKTLTVSDGATLNIADGATLKVGSGAKLNLAGANAKVTGKVDISGGGTVNAGDKDSQVPGLVGGNITQVTYYIDENGKPASVSGAVEVNEQTPMLLGEAGQTTWCVVNSPTPPSTSIDIGTRITISGDVHLILANSTTLTASKGIEVAQGDTLSIYAQSKAESEMGALTATGVVVTEYYQTAAAIGNTAADNTGGTPSTSGTINIYGGKITANGVSGAAAIGGGYNGNAGDITITGGFVNATGGNNAAGIGGGSKGGVTQGTGVGTITISGNAVVTATGGDFGAGIGSGNSATGENSGTITISGKAQVVAKGGQKAAGIGGGSKGDGCNINILGDANVSAYILL